MEGPIGWSRERGIGCISAQRVRTLSTLRWAYCFIIESYSGSPAAATSTHHPLAGPERAVLQPEPLDDHSGPIELAGLEAAPRFLIRELERLVQLGGSGEPRRVFLQDRLGICEHRLPRRVPRGRPYAIHELPRPFGRQEPRRKREQWDDVPGGGRGEHNLR